MKLVIKEYLASLKEREELDAVLPDLLSQMGLNVFSRPARGTRQDGVDVAAVGKIDGDTEDTVYLFSIKPGDLRRNDWDGGGAQSLRPSLTEIMELYIRNRLPDQYKDKPTKVCICVGGDIREEVRPSLRAFVEANTKERVSFEEWNGDRLASLIEDRFLREEFLPKGAQSLLRKSLALIDEPEASYRHFAELVRSVLAKEKMKPKERIQALRQLSICLWIVFSWAREGGNIEAAYLSAELLLLQGWNVVRADVGKNTKTTHAVTPIYGAILSAYQQVNALYLGKILLPHAGKLHGLSSAVWGSCSQDINLKLFDVLVRTALFGIWCFWQGQHYAVGADERKGYLNLSHNYADALKQMINNNPTLCLPLKDDQCIDIGLAVLLLRMQEDTESIGNWLAEIMDRSIFAYRTNAAYSCNIRSYSELLDHPERDDEYRKRVTEASILYPFIAIMAAQLGRTETGNAVKEFKETDLEHCNLQYWYPDCTTEDHIYVNHGLHGAVLSDVLVTGEPEELLKQVFGECDRTPRFNELSAVKYDFWPIVLTACRHYRLPVPLHLFHLSKGDEEAEDHSDDSESTE